jgi:hypothetical protein
MCVEASTVLRAVAVDFYFNCWYLEIPDEFLYIGTEIRHSVNSDVNLENFLIGPNWTRDQSQEN